jgi:transposase
MFIRTKKSGNHVYLQIAENTWEDGKTRQRIIATIGRLDVLQQTGALEGILNSGARFCEKLAVLDAVRGSRTTSSENIKIGPGLVFERLWRETGIRQVLEEILHDRNYEFPVERSIFLTVLHRLFSNGSDRAAEQWKEQYHIEGSEQIQLHHLYRAMSWLGEKLPGTGQKDATPFSPRCTKDLIEENLFSRRQDLFSRLDMVFFDTTSLYFEGEGGQDLGKRGNSKDHRPDLRQMVVGVVMDEDGNPVCCEMWPGNTTDVKSLVPIVQRMKKRFNIQQVCIVADRGMISKQTISTLEQPGSQIGYILGARMKKVKEIRTKVLGRAGRFKEVYPERGRSKDPSPLKVKEVWVDDRRYIVCLNEEQRRKDAADRESIIASLRDKLKQGDKSLVGNKGYRKYLKTVKEHFSIDEKRVKEDGRFDGKWVLQTNRDFSTEQTALKYKQLWMVEDIFRTMKSILQTRPIYHKCDETIRGHVFCSFLALIVRKELQDRLEAKGYADIEWAQALQDLDRLHETKVTISGKRFILREKCPGVSGKVIQAVGVALPPTLRDG